MNLVGKVINEIGFLREIARGARSRIFLVSADGQLHAAKLFLNEYKRFAEREYRFGSNLDHPNLNKITRLIEIEDYTGVLMPYMQGDHLGHYYSQSAEYFLGLFQSILEGLTYLHSHNIIHRDLKPENVIVVDHQPILFDFDLSAQVNHSNVRTTLAGTIAYFSPEEIKGQPATKASDLYAAAIMLYRALTGEVPFSGTVEEVIHAHQHRTPHLASHFNPSLRPFDAILEKSLAKNPKDRFESAQALSNALKQINLTRV